MKIISNIFERLPGVWFLLGLLFNAAGLYLGFGFSLAFVYMIIGWFCCAYGVALFVFRIIERPEVNESTRLSPNFISASSQALMANTQNEDQPQPARSAPAAEPQ